MSQKEAIAKAPERRVTRAALGTRNVLTVQGKDPDYQYRIVNDVGDRIQGLQDLGYEIVESKSVRIGDKRVGNPTPEGSKAQVSVGGGDKAFLMRQRKDWYEEDQAAKQEQVNKTEAAMKQEALNGADYGKLTIPRNSS